MVTILVSFALISCSNNPIKQHGTSVEQNLYDSASITDDTLLPSDESIIKNTLENGLTYIIKPNARPEDIVEFRLVVKAGSIHEDESQLGFAHFVEHMAFNGTQDFAENEIIDFVESIGMRFGAHLNATTGFDTTIYKLRVPTTDPSNLDRAVHILENWAHKITFNEQDVNAERGVILEEWRARKGVGERIAKQQWPVVFAGTNYAERIPIGTEENIINGDLEDIKRFYDTWYHPENMAIVVVGDVNPESIETLIKTYFEPLSNQRSVSEEVVSNPTELKQVQFLEQFPAPIIKVITDPELTGINLQITWRTNLFSPFEPISTDYAFEQYKNQVIKNLTLGILRKRFADLTLDTQSAFALARVSVTRIIPSAEGFMLSASIKPNRVYEAYESLLTEIKRAVLHGITQQEFEKEKQIYLEWYESALASQNTIDHGAFVNNAISHVIDNQPLLSIEQDHALAQLALKEIRKEDLEQQIKTWAEHQNATVFFTAANEMERQIPDISMLDDIWRDVQFSQPDPLEESILVEGLINQAIKPGSVTSKQYLPDWDAHQWTLSNGIEVVLKPTPFKDNQILFNAISQGGYSKVSDDDYLKSFGMLNTLNYMGLGSLNMQDFNQFARDKQFSVNASVTDYTESLSGASNQEDLIYLMQTSYLRFTAPLKDQERFEWIKDTYRPRLENKYNDPMALFYAAIREKTDSGNPRSVEFNVDALDKQDLDTIFRIYQQRFNNPADFVFVFVGDLDLEKMDTLLSQYIASLPTNEQFEMSSALPNFPLKGAYEVHLPISSEPKANVILTKFKDLDWSFTSQVKTALLNGVLERQLRERLREDLGGVYSVSVNSDLTRWPHQRYRISVNFTCAPDNIDTLVQEVDQIFDDLKGGNVTAVELENIKTQVLTQRTKSLKTNEFWLSYITNHFTLNKPLELDKQESLVESISVKEIVDFAQDALNTDTYVFATLTPEASIKESVESD